MVGSDDESPKGKFLKKEDKSVKKADNDVKPRRNRWVLTVGACVLTVDILLIALISILVVKRAQHKAVCPDPEEFCLPCKFLSLSPGENKQHFREFEYDRVDVALDSDCCARSPEKLQRLIEIFVIRRQRIRRLKEITLNKNHTAAVSGTSGGSDWRRAAHLVKQDQSTLVITAENKIDIEWDNEVNSSSTFVKGLERRQHRVVVTDQGYYYVYSQLMFEELANSSDTLGRVCHFLIRYRPDTQANETLLDNSQKLVGIADKTHSSYLGAVFKFEKGDAIGIKASGSGTRINPERHPHGNFFGMYKV